MLLRSAAAFNSLGFEVVQVKYKILVFQILNFGVRRVAGRNGRTER